MRIGFICTEMLPSPSIRGGAIQILIDGIAPIIARAHDLTIFSVTDPDLEVQETVDGVKYIRFPKEDYVPCITEYLRENDPFDVIHVFNRPKNVAAYKQAAPSTAFVLSLHNEMFHPKKISDEEALKCLDSVETIMTVSNYIGKTVTERFPQAKSKLRTVYSGADLTRYDPVWQCGDKRNLIRDKLGIKDQKVILFVGRLSEKKGAHILIEAFKKLLSSYPDTVLMIVGGRWFSDDSVDTYVSKLYKSSESVKDKIIFTKFVSPAEIPDYYLASDIFVCASQWQEPLARVHYEAMAAGLPVITTRRGGNPEMVRNHYNGIVIDDYSNPDAFANEIEALLSRPDISYRMGRRGWNLARRFCNVSRAANELLDIYKKCTTLQKRRHPLVFYFRK